MPRRASGNLSGLDGTQASGASCSRDISYVLQPASNGDHPPGHLTTPLSTTGRVDPRDVVFSYLTGIHQGSRRRVRNIVMPVRRMVDGILPHSGCLPLKGKKLIVEP